MSEKNIDHEIYEHASSVKPMDDLFKGLQINAGMRRQYERQKPEFARRTVGSMLSESSRGGNSNEDRSQRLMHQETKSVLDETTNTAGFNSFLNKDRSIGPSGGQ